MPCAKYCSILYECNGIDYINLTTYYIIDDDWSDALQEKCSPHGVGKGYRLTTWCLPRWVNSIKTVM